MTEQSSEASEVRKLWIPGPSGRLEAMLRAACPVRAAAVVAHPHPLHGGTLHNPVIFHSDRELHRAGFTTLRFNFRGVGESDGEYDEGRGEVDDVAAAVSWLRGVALGVPMFLVGFSFGSVCSLQHAVRGGPIQGLIALGLPVRLNPFEDVDRLSCPFAVVQADADEFGTPEDVRPILERAPRATGLWTIEDTTHLFPGRARDAAAGVVAAAETMLGER